MYHNSLPSLLACAVLATSLSAAAEDTPQISPATRDGHDFLIHEVESSYQAGKTEIRVLLPDNIPSDTRCRVIYVLPVEAGKSDRYGDGLLEVKRHNLANKHTVVFVAPTFSQLPWYADHPTDRQIRQESYFVRVVVPFIEKTYAVAIERDGRLLLGFSKSGWGAWSLLLRHPETFARAAAWDSPMMMDRPGKYGSGDIFGSQESFDRYRITMLLRARRTELTGDAAGGADRGRASRTVRSQAEPGNEKRLILTGYGNFRQEHQQIHNLLNELQIPHEYRDGPARRHDWHSGWLSESVELLLSTSAKELDKE